MVDDLGTIRGQISLDVRRAVASYAALRAQNARTVYALRGTGDSFTQAGRTMGVAGGVMVYAFAKVVDAAAEYERKMDYFGAVTDTNKKKMDQLSQYSLQLAQDTIYSAGEIADGMVELGKAGVSAEQIMHGVGDAMASLGAAGDIPLAQSGQIITSTIQQFNLKAQDATHVADELAGAANASIADISDLGVSLKYVGGVASAAGLGFDDTTTAISLLAKAGIRGSTAGTSLRQMIVSFPGATGPAYSALQELGIITEDGTNKFYDMQGNLKPLAKVFQILQNHTNGLTREQKLLYMRQIFNNRALAAAAILTRDGAKGFKDMYGAMSKVKAADVAHKRLDNLSGDIEILKGNIETLMVQQGSPFQEMLRGWVQRLTKLIQAFGNLSPQTQKNIVAFIGIAGASLVAMGAFNILVGTVFKFVASMIKMGAGIKFIVTHLKNLWVWARLLTSVFADSLIAAVGAVAAALGLTVGVFLAVVAVVAAVVAGLVILYFKWGAFHDLVNNVVSSIWNAIKAIGQFAKDLVTNPGRAIDTLKSMLSQLGGWFGKVFSQIGQAMVGGLRAGVTAVGQFVQRVVAWFLSLPGRALGALGNFVTKLRQMFTLKNVSYAVGFAVGRVIRWFGILGIRMLSLSAKAVTGVWNWFSKLGPRVIAWVLATVNRVQAFFQRMRARMVALAIAAVNGTVNFFQKLPGRVAAFVASMVGKAVAFYQRMRAQLPQLAAAAVNGTINFIQQLPGRVGAFISSMVARAVALFNRFRTQAISMARAAASGFVAAITGLPGVVAGVVNNIIAAFTDAIGRAASAARSMASSMWEGFKDGIGMHSPSHFERAMWQITGTVDKELKKLGKQTLGVQKLSKKVSATKFEVGSIMPHGADEYIKLASMHSRNQNRARTLQDSSGIRAARDHAARNERASHHRLVHGELDISPNGKAFIRGTAQEVYDDNDSFAVSTGRMDY